MCVFLFRFGIISFRAIPRVLEVIFSCFELPFKPCHFTSVINWCLKIGWYKLHQLSPLSEPWTAIIDASIEWGNKKMLVVLRVPSLIMRHRSKALDFKEIEVVGLFVKEVVNGQVIADLLHPLFSQLGHPTQILTDGGSDLAKGIRLLESSTFTCIHTLDIGHFAANILKRLYIDDEQFKALIAFTAQIGSKLRQTVAAWMIPNKLRTKARFQGVSTLAEWTQKAFEYCKEHLKDCDQKTQALLEEQFQGYEFLVEFSDRFSQDCQIINNILKLLKCTGLSKETLSESIGILSTLPPNSELRIQLESYLVTNFQKLSVHGVDDGLISTDIIESLFGKIKYIIERSPTRDFNKLCLLLPMLVGELNEDLIINATTETKMKNLLQWDEDNIEETLLRKKRNEFGKLKIKKQLNRPICAEIIAGDAA